MARQNYISNLSPAEFETRMKNRLTASSAAGVSLFRKFKKGDGYFGCCQNGKFEVYMPVTLGSGDLANLFGSCIYGRYESFAQGTKISYRTGRTFFARMCILAVFLLDLAVCGMECFYGNYGISVLLLLFGLVFLIMMLRIPKKDKEELQSILPIGENAAEREGKDGV